MNAIVYLNKKVADVWLSAAQWIFIFGCLIVILGLIGVVTSSIRKSAIMVVQALDRMTNKLLGEARKDTEP